MRFMPLAQELGKNEDELALIAMLLDDYYQQTLHSPPELPDIRQAAPRTEPRAEREPDQAREGGERKKRRRPRNRRKKNPDADNGESEA